MGSTTTIDPEDRARVLEHIRTEQRLAAGIVSGCVAGLIGAAVWAVISVFTNHEIGWIAIGVGWLVGIAVRFAGRGFEVRYAAIGGALALAAVAVGKFLAILGAFAQSEHVPFWEVLGSFPYGEFPTLMRETFEPMDLLFYGLAVWMGWTNARRTLAEDEIRAAFDRLKAER